MTMVLAAAAVHFITAAVAAPDLLAAVDLRCEGLPAPLGVDVFAPRLSWVPSVAAVQRGILLAAYRLTVATDAAFANVTWDTGRVASNATSARLPPAAALAPDTQYWWRVVWSGCAALPGGDACAAAAVDAPPAVSTLVTGLGPAGWGAASAAWLSCATVGACDYLRSPVLTLPAAPVRATLHLATGGWVEAWVNGARAGGDAALEGSWTQWNARMPATAYDVTALVVAGANAVGLVLGNGWWGHLGHRATAAAVLSVELPGGQRLRLATSAGGAGDAGAWRGSAGPIYADDIYNGEGYDARAEVPGWATASHDVGAWDGTVVVVDPLIANASISWQAVQPVQARRAAALPARSVTPAGGAGGDAQFVVDFGVNSAGWTRVTLPAGCPAGTVVSLLHAENLAADGTVDQGNLRSARATDSVTCDGRAAPLVFEPRFTYHGSRYVGVKGWVPAAMGGAPAPAAFAKVEVHNAVEYEWSPGTRPSYVVFANGTNASGASDGVLNEIQAMAVRGQLSNLHGGVATDCPQRDERQGWMADASVSAESALSSLDMRAFYAAWLRTIVDAQATTAFHDCAPASPIYPDCAGADTDTSPHVTGLFGNRPADPSWGAALDIIYDLHVRYFAEPLAVPGGAGSDAEDLPRALYPPLCSYLDWLLRVAAAQGGLVTFHYYGDWLQPGRVASADAVSAQTSAFNFLRSLRTGITAAGVQGDAARQARYGAAYAAAAAEYNARYYNVSGSGAPSGCYGGGSQAEQVFALYLGLQPGGDAALSAAVARCLLPAIAANGTHVDTGIISTKYLMPLLSRAGRTDVALQLALQTDFPSWGAMVARVFGQSTITEHWDPVSNPSGDGMSSRNHPAFSSVGAWLYAAALGLRLGDAASADFSVPGLPPPPPGAGAEEAVASLQPADGFGWSRAVVAPEAVTLPALPGAAGGQWTVRGWVGAAWAYTPPAAAGSPGPQSPPQHVLSLNASFPPGVRGEVRTPPGGSPFPPSALTVADAQTGAAVWAAGAFVPGAVQGVWTGAVCGRGADRVCLSVGSGDFAFVVSAAAAPAAA